MRLPQIWDKDTFQEVTLEAEKSIVFSMLTTMLEERESVPFWEVYSRLKWGSGGSAHTRLLRKVIYSLESEGKLSMDDMGNIRMA